MLMLDETTGGGGNELMRAVINYGEQVKLSGVECER